MYPPIDAQQPVHPSQMQQPQGFQGYPPMQQQGYPAAPPNYDGSPNMIHHQQPVITQQPSKLQDNQPVRYNSNCLCYF